VAFGTIFLIISSAAWKTLLGLPQLPQATAASNLKTINKRVGPFCSIGVGSFYVVKSSKSAEVGKSPENATGNHQDFLVISNQTDESSGRQE
jgi:hypothetical protein